MGKPASDSAPKADALAAATDVSDVPKPEPGGDMVLRLCFFDDHPEEVPLRRAITFPAAVALAFWCAANFVVVDALAASLEHVEFESASQPLIPGDRIQGLLAKPDGAGPFPAVVGLHGCDGMHEAARPRLADALVASGYVTLLVDSFATR